MFISTQLLVDEDSKKGAWKKVPVINQVDIPWKSSRPSKPNSPQLELLMK